MKKLAVKEGMTREEQRLALEAASLLGFQTEAAVFPIAGMDGELPIPRNEEELRDLFSLPETLAGPGKKSRLEAPSGQEAVEKRDPASLFELDFRRERGLEELFGPGPFLQDRDLDFLPDSVEVKLALPEAPDASLMTAACNLAFRLGMETTAYQGGILAEAGWQGNQILLEKGEAARMELEKGEGRIQVRLRGQGAELEELSSAICGTFPGTGGWRTFRDVLLDMCDSAALRNGDGQLAELKRQKEGPEGKGEYRVYGSPDLTQAQKALFPDVAFENYKAGKKAYERTYQFPWEVETAEGRLEEAVYPLLQAGDLLQVKGVLSEGRESRRKLEARIRQKAEAKGAAAEAEILCAYKQGFSWLDESVIPAVRAKGPDRVEIYFRSFLPEGQTQWQDENGATPTRMNLKEADADKWYDLPVRWLQELYPIEDVLVRELGIHREQVVFLPYKEETENTYLCRAYREGAVCYEGTFQVHYTERPYLDAYPEMGKVHPSTGYLEAWINGRPVLSQRIRTDLEGIWDTYQAQVLPECERYIEEKNGGVVTAEQQPFFQELRLEISLSEPDYPVGCREDLLSSLDGLHEDLYFVGSDYFKKYGIRTAGVALDAPGLILPRIHPKEGRPSLQVTLLEKTREKACVERDGRVVASQRDRDGLSFWVSGLEIRQGKLWADVRAQGVDEGFQEAYAALLEQGALEICQGWEGVGGLRFVREDGSGIAEARIPEAEAPAQDRSIGEIDFHEREVIGYEQYREIVEQLKRVPGLEVFRTARSYAGRELFGVRLAPRREGYVSWTKRLTQCPTLLINARHHANEVSSTNAAFMLLKKLLTEADFRELPEKLNLVLVPMENVDGAAIHYELQKEHPCWKYHVARFNAVGKEFFQDHFLPDTLHQEAMGLTRLYRRYLPDVVVDNHGVPSHEWEQQFSGYTPPAFKGFWLPRALLYGYFWYVTDQGYEGNYALGKEMEDRIAEAINQDPEMAAWNQEWRGQFEKYAHAWLPRLFPAEYYKNMINYWTPYSYKPTHSYPALRFPWITAVSYTSEVADETAQGDYLYLCARAHAAHDEATIRMLMEAENVYACQAECRKGETKAVFQRLRPVRVNQV